MAATSTTSQAESRTDSLPNDASQPPLSELSSPASTLSKAPTIQAFTLFPDFPSELRIKIWEQCLPHQTHLYEEQGIKKGLYPFHGKHCKAHLAGSKAAQLPVISRVCWEARSVALENGSMRKTMVYQGSRNTYRCSVPHMDLHQSLRRETSDVWVDNQRDTVLINKDFPIRSYEFPEEYDEEHRDTINDIHVRSLIRKKQIRIAVLDEVIHMDGIEDYTSLTVYKDLINGHKECDLGLVEMRFDITDEEAVHTNLFGLFGIESMALVPFDDPHLMDELFTAQKKFNPRTIYGSLSSRELPISPLFRNPADLGQDADEWKNWGAQRSMAVKHHMARLLATEEAGHAQLGMSLKKVWGGEGNEPHDRIAEIEASVTKFCPVVVVHRCSRCLMADFS